MSRNLRWCLRWLGIGIMFGLVLTPTLFDERLTLEEVLVALLLGVVGVVIVAFSLEVKVRDLPLGRVQVSDLGETLRTLSNQGFDPRNSPWGEHVLGRILMRHQVTLFRGQLVKQVSPQSEVGQAMHDVLMACLELAQLAEVHQALVENGMTEKRDST